MTKFYSILFLAKRTWLTFIMGQAALEPTPGVYNVKLTWEWSEQIVCYANGPQTIYFCNREELRFLDLNLAPRVDSQNASSPCQCSSPMGQPVQDIMTKRVFGTKRAVMWDLRCDCLVLSLLGVEFKSSQTRTKQGRLPVQLGRGMKIPRKLSKITIMKNFVTFSQFTSEPVVEARGELTVGLFPKEDSCLYKLAYIC